MFSKQTCSFLLDEKHFIPRSRYNEFNGLNLINCAQAYEINLKYPYIYGHNCIIVIFSLFICMTANTNPQL